jgi:hypothetical protein
MTYPVDLALNNTIINKTICQLNTERLFEGIRLKKLSVVLKEDVVGEVIFAAKVLKKIN